MGEGVRLRRRYRGTVAGPGEEPVDVAFGLFRFYLTLYLLHLNLISGFHLSCNWKKRSEVAFARSQRPHQEIVLLPDEIAGILRA